MTASLASQCSPSEPAFSALYDDGKAQLVYRRVINDLDTPVSAYLKIAKNRPYAFYMKAFRAESSAGAIPSLAFLLTLFGDATGTALRSRVQTPLLKLMNSQR